MSGGGEILQRRPRRQLVVELLHDVAGKVLHAGRRPADADEADVAEHGRQVVVAGVEGEVVQVVPLHVGQVGIGFLQHCPPF